MAKQGKKRSTTAKNKGRSLKVKEILHRTFGDLPIIDAKSDLRISITRADVKRGVRGNPAMCAIAQGCKREFGSSAAVIFKTRAYVDVLGEDGVRRVERFRLSPTAQAVVVAFDKGERVPSDGRWLVLSAPTPSQTLDADLRRQRRRRNAIKQGTYTPASSGNPASPREEPRDVEVRHGTGQWQMLKKELAAA